ncbi:hypothetical protein [Brevibacillus sp. SIMBA_040]|uniref:hypothetical protein n=1 Tax=unclassified Brevibacillus TaxID=2684853 RepID=UPI00397C7904
MEFARFGLGTACINCSFVTKELEDCLLFELHPQSTIPLREIGIETRRDINIQE